MVSKEYQTEEKLPLYWQRVRLVGRDFLAGLQRAEAHRRDMV